MCVSFRIPQNAKVILEQIKARQRKAPRFGERIYPFQPAPVLVQENNERILTPMDFSLIPAWSKDRKPRFATYNARLDTKDEKTGKHTMIYDKPTWKEPFLKRHCLIPMDMFFESVYEGPHKGNIISFSAEGKDFIVAAGIWDEWTDKGTGEIVESFSVLTDEPYPFIDQMGHDRSPIFLEEKSFDEWLSPSDTIPDKMVKFLRAKRVDYDWAVTNDRPLKKGWEKRA